MLRFGSTSMAIAACICAGAFIVAAPPAAAEPGAGSIGIRLEPASGTRPADALERLYIVAHVQPRTRFVRQVTVTNATDRELPIRLYVGAARFAGGTFT